MIVTDTNGPTLELIKKDFDVKVSFRNTDALK